MSSFNCYEDATLADAYARLEFPGTYHLAFRDLPALFRRHVTGRRAVDFGCGAGRSTRFLRRHGYDAAGVDISADMLANARALDPAGDYRLVPDGDLGVLGDASCDLALSAFTFDNIPTRAQKARCLREIARVLKPGGRMVNLVSSPDIYVHEWASFSTKDYPGNRHARSGDAVLIVNTAIADRRPVRDVVWSDASYRETYAEAGLAVVEVHRPLGRDDEPCAWVNETRIAPWVIWVLEPAGGA
jgi:SAM-dependent methyltransferase